MDHLAANASVVMSAAGIKSVRDSAERLGLPSELVDRLNSIAADLAKCVLWIAIAENDRERADAERLAAIVKARFVQIENAAGIAVRGAIEKKLRDLLLEAMDAIDRVQPEPPTE